jgi:PPOX class probable F420-dependent enzyme
LTRQKEELLLSHAAIQLQILIIGEKAMPKLTVEEMRIFLQERSHLARIATVCPDGSPSVVPIWFLYEGGKILITPRKPSAFYANIQREPRVGIAIDEEAARYRKVLIEGAAEILFIPGQDEQWRDVYRRLCCRYVDEESADHYVNETSDQPRALIGVTLAAAKVTTWRMPAADEPYTGIWHKRYYDDGAKMAQSAATGGGTTMGDRLKVT